MIPCTGGCGVAHHIPGSAAAAACRPTSSASIALPAAPPPFDSSISEADVAEMMNDFTGRFGDCPDAIELLAEHLGVHPSTVVYSEIDLDPRVFSPGAAAFDEIEEREYVAEMAAALRRGEALPPVLVADVATVWHPYALIDGNHRAAAYAEAGLRSMPAVVGSAPSGPIHADVHPADEEDQHVYMNGECLHYGVALARRHQLHLGVVWSGDRNDEFTYRHVVAHDGRWAYDASGVHELTRLTSHPGVEYELHLDEEGASVAVHDYIREDEVATATEALR